MEDNEMLHVGAFCFQKEVARIVNAYLDLGGLRAEEQVPMIMED